MPVLSTVTTHKSTVYGLKGYPTSKRLVHAWSLWDHLSITKLFRIGQDRQTRVGFIFLWWIFVAKRVGLVLFSFQKEKIIKSRPMWWH